MKASNTEEAHDEWVAIREEEQGWIQELSHMLLKEGIHSNITLAPGCSAGSCGCKFRLLVEKKDVKLAISKIDEYYIKLHPELEESEEWASQGKCPACGHQLNDDAKECSDCGLTLIFEEEN